MSIQLKDQSWAGRQAYRWQRLRNSPITTRRWLSYRSALLISHLRSQRWAQMGIGLSLDTGFYVNFFGLRVLSPKRKRSVLRGMLRHPASGAKKTQGESMV